MISGGKSARNDILVTRVLTVNLRGRTRSLNTGSSKIVPRDLTVDSNLATSIACWLIRKHHFTEYVLYSGVLIIIDTYNDKVLYNVIKQACVLIDCVFISIPANGVAIQLTLQIFEDSIPSVTVSPISL